MPITDRLSRRLHEALGEEAASEMVDWMHRLDDQRAILRDLNELNFSRIDARFREVDARFGQMEARLGQMDARLGQMDARLEGFDARFGEMDARLGKLQADMQTGFARLETRIEQRTADIMKWSFGFWVGSVLAITGALAALSRFLPS